MRTKWLDALRAVGVTPEQLEAIDKAFPTERRAKISYADGCPACGQKPTRFDYACGACSTLKAGKPRRFWQYAAERVEGGQGRPIDRPLDPEEKRAIAAGENSRLKSANDNLKVELRAVPDDLPDKPPPPVQHRWLVSSGIAHIVIVAPWSYLAVRWAKRLMEWEDTQPASWWDMGEVDAAPTITDESKRIEPLFGSNG